VTPKEDGQFDRKEMLVSRRKEKGGISVDASKEKKQQRRRSIGFLKRSPQILETAIWQKERES